MLPRVTYRKVLKLLERYRQQHEADRQENPQRIPLGWVGPLNSGISQILAEDRVFGDRKRLIADTIQNLVKGGVLVEYAGDVTFPGEVLPSREEIIVSAQRELKRINS